MLNSLIEDCVLWLGEREPNAELDAHLRARGLAFHVERDAFGEWINPLPVRRMATLDEYAMRVGGRPTLGGRRVLVLHPDALRAEAVAEELRAYGAEVRWLTAASEPLRRVEQFDPDVVLVEPRFFYGEGWLLVSRVWDHPRLRWATLLLTLPNSLSGERDRAPELRPVCDAIQRLSMDAARLRALARQNEEFELTLHRLGPARTLRLLGDAPGPIRAEFRAPEATIEVDAKKGLIVGARATRHGDVPERLFGASALALCLRLNEGYVSVRSIAHPAAANVMAALDEALHVASLTTLPEVTDLPTRPQPFEDAPTRQWDEPRLRRDEATDDDDEPTIAQPSSTLPGVQKVLASADTVGSLAAPRTPAKTFPFQVQGWFWRTLQGAVFGAAVVGVIAWMMWPEPPPPAGIASATSPAERTQASEPALPGAAPVATQPGSVQPGSVQPGSPEPALSLAADAGVLGELADAGLAQEGDEAVESDESARSTALSRSPTARANALAEEAILLRERGRYTEARARFLEALALWPGCPRALAGLTRLALAEDNPEEAVKYAEQLVRERPGQGVYHAVLGDAYRAAGREQKARAAYRTAVRLGHHKARAKLRD